MATVLLPPRQQEAYKVEARIQYPTIVPLPGPTRVEARAAFPIKIKDGCFQMHFDRYVKDAELFGTVSQIEQDLSKLGVVQLCGVFHPNNSEAARKISQKQFVVPGVHYFAQLPFDKKLFPTQASVFSFAYITDEDFDFSSAKLKDTVETVIGGGFSRLQIPISHKGAFTQDFVNWIGSLDQRGVKVYLVHGVQAITSRLRPDATLGREGLADYKNVFFGTAIANNSIFDVPDRDLMNIMADPQLAERIVFESSFDFEKRGRLDIYRRIYERVQQSIGDDKRVFCKNLERFLA